MKKLDLNQNTSELLRVLSSQEVGDVNGGITPIIRPIMRPIIRPIMVYPILAMPIMRPIIRPIMIKANSNIAK